MVKFGEKIESVRQHQSNELWGIYYYDYNALKRILDEGKKQQQQQNTANNESNHLHRRTSSSWHDLLLNRTRTTSIDDSSNTAIPQPHREQQDMTTIPDFGSTNHYYSGSGIHPITSQFLQLLDNETEKVVLFLLQQQGIIAQELYEIHNWFRQLTINSNVNNNDENVTSFKTSFNSYNNNAGIDDADISYVLSNEQIDLLEQRYYTVGVQLLKLVRYCEMNIQGLRKILKKHDKIIPKYKLSSLYLNKHNDAMSTVRQHQHQFASQHHYQHYQIQRFNDFVTGGAVTPSSSWRPRSNQNNRSSSNALPSSLSSVTSCGNRLVQPLLHDESLNSLILSFQVGITEFKQFIMVRLKQQQVAAAVRKDPNARIDDDGDDKMMMNNSSGQRNDRSVRRILSAGDLPVPGFSSPIKDDDVESSNVGHPLLMSNSMRVHRTSGSNTHIKRNSFSQTLLLQPFDDDNNTSWKIQRTEYILLQIYSAQRRLVETNNLIVTLLAASFEVLIHDDPRIESADEYDIDINSKLIIHHDYNVNNVDNDDDSAQRRRQEEDVIRLLNAQHGQKYGPIRTSRQQVSDWLNLMSTFLFMTNYYIVAPTSSIYAMKLGASASMASMIIGMTPVAAMIAAILYSWWTSTSYKPALIFASVCSLIGNILYTIGLPCNSIRLVMIGRLLNGFGSARSINRRYIADVFSREHRTAAAAIFVTAGAMGMAAGPAIASLLIFISTSYYPTTSLYWQKENSPGTFMAIVWAIYIVCFILFFEDPKKSNSSITKKKKHNNSSDNTVTATTIIADNNGEKTPLLLNNANKMDPTIKAKDSKDTNKTANEIPIWQNTSAMMTFFIYFVLKLCLETVLSATSVLTGFYFHWNGTVMGIYLACLGLLMLPANVVVAYYARQSYEDREMIVVMIAGTVVGCIACIQYCKDPADYPVVQFIIGSVILFVSSTALEGPAMSLLSKSIPKSWSAGFFNVGLLATEAGTFGRVVADIFLSTVGASGGLDQLLNRTFGTFAFVTSFCLLLTLYFYQSLEPYDQDD